MERIQIKDHLLTEGIKRWKELIPKIIDEMFHSSKPPIKEVVNVLKRKEVKDWEGEWNFHVASINFTKLHVWQSLVKNVHYSGSQLLRKLDFDRDGTMYVFIFYP